MKKGFRIIKFKKNKPVLQVRNISKSFDGRPILKKISLEVNPGEIVGLIGPNGAGKSTLYSSIIGQHKVDSGDIFLNGKNITELPIHARSRLGIAYLSQYRSLFNMNVYSNLLAVAEIAIKEKKKQREMVEKLLVRFNLSHLSSLNQSALSGGEARRLQMARTLITNPKVILLDEPTSALDPIVVQDILNHILNLQSDGTGVIVTDHNFFNLKTICDKFFVIGEQTVIAQGTKEQILGVKKVRDLYFGNYEV